MPKAKPSISNEDIDNLTLDFFLENQDLDPLDYIEAIPDVHSLLQLEVEKELLDLQKPFASEGHLLLSKKGFDLMANPAQDKAGIYPWQFKIILESFQGYCRKCSNPKYFEEDTELWHREPLQEILDHVQLLDFHPKQDRISYCKKCKSKNHAI